MITQELLDYINAQRQRGMGDAEIRQSLIHNGWAESDVHAAFSGTITAHTTPTPTPAAPGTMSRDEAVTAVKQLGKFKASWRLFSQSLGLLKQDKEIILFPIISSFLLIALAIAVSVGMWTGGMLEEGSNEFVFYGALFAYYVVAHFILTYFRVGLTAIVYERINGGDIGFSDGMSRAAKISGKILAWSLLASTVGIVLKIISDKSKTLGKLVANLLGAAWNIVTMFIAPTLLLDDVSVWQSVKNSGAIFKKTWGETIIMNISLGLINIVIFFGTVMMFAMLFSISISLGFGLTGLIVVGILMLIVLIITSVFFTTLSEIFKVALYSYARFGIVAEGFSPELIIGAVKESKKD